MGCWLGYNKRMSKRASWAIIGFGNIGKELCRQLAQPAVARRVGLKTRPEFIVRSNDVIKPDGNPAQYKNFAAIKELPDVIFIAMPSTDDGRPAYEYIASILAAGKLVVTAEKGALANYFSKLKKESDGFRRLGVNATVGGGTRLVSTLQAYCEDKANIRQLHLALNGTLTAVFSSLAAGQPLDKAVQKAVRAGLAEPGHHNSYDVIRSEAEGDIPKKTAILFNRLGLSGEVLDWQKLRFELTDREIRQAVKQAKTRRFIVSIYPTTKLTDDGVVGGFSTRHDGWLVRGGFRQIKCGSLLAPLANLAGADNGFVIGLGPDGTDGVYSLTGPGAGVRPTVNAMIDDYLAGMRR